MPPIRLVEKHWGVTVGCTVVSLCLPASRSKVNCFPNTPLPLFYLVWKIVQTQCLHFSCCPGSASNLMPDRNASRSFVSCIDVSFIKFYAGKLRSKISEGRCWRRGKNPNSAKVDFFLTRCSTPSTNGLLSAWLGKPCSSTALVPSGSPSRAASWSTWRARSAGPRWSRRWRRSATPWWTPSRSTFVTNTTDTSLPSLAVRFSI